MKAARLPVDSDLYCSAAPLNRVAKQPFNPFRALLWQSPQKPRDCALISYFLLFALLRLLCCGEEFILSLLLAYSVISNQLYSSSASSLSFFLYSDLTSLLLSASFCTSLQHTLSCQALPDSILLKHKTTWGIFFIPLIFPTLTPASTSISTYTISTPNLSEEIHLLCMYIYTAGMEW